MEGAFVEYCRQNLHQPVATFFSSASQAVPEDAEYRRMVEYMRSSGSEFLVVVPSARDLGADLESVTRSLIELGQLGATIACSDDEFPNPLQNAFQTLGIKGVSRTRSQRIKESMRARALKGQALGRPLYGYRIGPNGTLEVVREEAVVVELIYRLFTREGLGLRLIAQHLNERQIPTRRGGRWNVVSIRDILRNISYTGTYERFGMRRARTHEAIIPSEVFRAAQDLTKERRPVGRVMNPQPFMLSGMVYCSYCGNKMMGVTRRQTWKRKDGRRNRQAYRYYQCQTRNNQSLCGYHTWRAPLLESTVISQLKYALQARPSDEQVEAGNEGPGQDHARARQEAELKNAESRFLQAVKRAAGGGTKLHILGEYLAGLDAARREAESEAPEDDPTAVIAAWDSLDLESRRSFLFRRVARIDVTDDVVEIELHRPVTAG